MNYKHKKDDKIFIKKNLGKPIPEKLDLQAKFVACSVAMTQNLLCGVELRYRRAMKDYSNIDFDDFVLHKDGLYRWKDWKAPQIVVGNNRILPFQKGRELIYVEDIFDKPSQTQTSSCSNSSDSENSSDGESAASSHLQNSISELKLK